MSVIFLAYEKTDLGYDISKSALCTVSNKIMIKQVSHYTGDWLNEMVKAIKSFQVGQIGPSQEQRFKAAAAGPKLDNSIFWLIESWGEGENPESDSKTRNVTFNHVHTCRCIHLTHH